MHSSEPIRGFISGHAKLARIRAQKPGKARSAGNFTKTNAVWPPSVRRWRFTTGCYRRLLAFKVRRRLSRASSTPAQTTFVTFTPDSKPRANKIRQISDPPGWSTARKGLTEFGGLDIVRYRSQADHNTYSGVHYANQEMAFGCYHRGMRIRSVSREACRCTGVGKPHDQAR